MAKTQDDKQQVGLTPEADEMIKGIATNYFGGSQQDAYRFAISYAIAADLDPAEAPGGQVTKYSVLGTLETGTSLRDLLEILHVGDPHRPFATAEKLAELGVREIARRLNGSESLGEIMESFTANAPIATDERGDEAGYVSS